MKRKGLRRLDPLSLLAGRSQRRDCKLQGLPEAEVGTKVAISQKNTSYIIIVCSTLVAFRGLVPFHHTKRAEMQLANMANALLELKLRADF